MDVTKSEPSKNGAVQRECGGCGEVITERWISGHSIDNYRLCMSKANASECHLYYLYDHMSNTRNIIKHKNNAISDERN